jgi:hypothetical protein
MEADDDAGRHHQRRRHRRLLSQPLPPAPPRDRLGDRDLYGELASAARTDGLVVVARMDSNRAHEDFYRAHPDWFAVDAQGKPYLNTGLYVACVNSPYYDEYIPSVLREIIERSHPEGFADNNWNGLGRDNICYCGNCTRKFSALAGSPVPQQKNWDDPVYRKWIQWNYARRVEIWDLFNHVTREAGGPDCLWIGMNSGSISGQARAFRDMKAIGERSALVLLDHQARSDASGFQSNAQAGKLLHGLIGWDKLIPESMSMYQNARNQFRLSSKPTHEAQLWMLDGFAGGIQPWWHHIGAYQEDRRMLHTAEPVMRWHAANERYLVNRRPVANVGLVWSQANTDYHGRDASEDIVDLPERGWVNALVRARIQYVPVHADHIARDAAELSVLILPDLGAMSRTQVDAVRAFVARGGALVATGESSRYDDVGDPLAISRLPISLVRTSPLARSAAAPRRRRRDTPIFASRPSFGLGWTDRTCVASHASPANATPRSRDSRRPTSSRSAACCPHSRSTAAHRCCSRTSHRSRSSRRKTATCANRIPTSRA